MSINLFKNTLNNLHFKKTISQKQKLINTFEIRSKVVNNTQ